MSLPSYRTRNVLFTSYTFTLHREEKTWSTVLNPRRAKEFVVPSTLTRYIMGAALFFADVPGTFFQRDTHQAESITIAISEENLLVVEIGCLL